MHDRRRIFLEQNWEVIYWSERFGVSVDALRAAVAKVGPVARAVEEYLDGGRVKEGSS